MPSILPFTSPSVAGTQHLISRDVQEHLPAPRAPLNRTAGYYERPASPTVKPWVRGPSSQAPANMAHTEDTGQYSTLATKADTDLGFVQSGTSMLFTWGSSCPPGESSLHGPLVNNYLYAPWLVLSTVKLQRQSYHQDHTTPLFILPPQCLYSDCND